MGSRTVRLVIACLLAALTIPLTAGHASAQPLTYISLPGGIDGHWYANPTYEPDACVALWHEGADARMIVQRINYTGQITRQATDGAANGNNACIAISSDTRFVRIIIQRDDGVPSYETWEAWRANAWIGLCSGPNYNYGGCG